MFNTAICLCFAVLVLVRSQENVTIETGERDITVNVTNVDDKATYRLGYGTDNLTWVDLLGAGDSYTFVHYNVINRNPGSTYIVKITKSGTEIYNQNVTTKPLPPTVVKVTAAGTSFLYVTWETDLDSEQEGGIVYVTSNSSEMKTYSIASGMAYNITDLQPGAVYTISVATVSQGQQSRRSTDITDNTVPLPPTISTIHAIDTKTLLVTWTTTGGQDNVFLTATYNDTGSNRQQTVKLFCQMVIHACVTNVPGIPGQTLQINAYATKGVRESTRDSKLHSTTPETALGLLDNSSSTSYLHLTILPPISSFFNLYYVEVYHDNGSDFTFEHNISLSKDETDIFLWNLTAGSMYNVTVSTRTMWEESEIFSAEFVTYPFPPQNLQLKSISNTSVTTEWAPIKSGGLDYYQASITPKEPLTRSPVQQDIHNRRVTFSDLTPGKRYTVGVRAVKQKKTSTQITKEFWTAPNPPELVNITVRSGRELDVDWSPPSLGYVDYYTIFISSDHMHQKNVTQKVTITYFRFTSLHPGENYTVHIRSHIGDMTSPVITASAVTNPSSVAELYVDHVGVDSINVSWPRPNGSIYDTFSLTIDPADVSSPILIPASSDILHHTFTGLRSGQNYKISVATVNQGTQSDQATVYVITEPMPVVELNVTSHDPETLNLEWRTPSAAQQHHFLIQYHDVLDSGNKSLPSVLALHDKTVYATHILNLKAGHLYSVYVQAKQVYEIGNDSFVAYSKWLHVNKSTKPYPVTNLTYTSSSSAITLSWLPGSNSLQDTYFVWYRAILGNVTSQWKRNSSDDTSSTLTGLFPGLVYEMVVFAVSHMEMSQPTMVTTQMPPLPPRDLSVKFRNSTSITFTWTYDTNSTVVESWNLAYTSVVDGSGLSVNIPANSSQTDMSITLENLRSGHMYEIIMYSIVQNSMSKSVYLNVSVQPEIKTTLAPGMIGINNISVAYSKETNYFEYYNFEVLNTTTVVVQKNKNDTKRVVSFTGLQGGTSYTVRATAVSGDQTSDPIYIAIQTAPEIPYVEREIKSRSVKLILQYPAGHVDSYNVSCSPSCGSHLKPANQPRVVVEFTGLAPYTEYQFTVRSIAGKQSTSLFIVTNTNEAAPTPVRNLNVVEVQPLTVQVSWSPPQMLNGKLLKYHVVYSAVNEMNQVVDNNRKDISVTQELSYRETITEMFTDLQAGLKYTFNVSASTILESEAVSQEIILRTYNPPYKSGITQSQTKPKRLNAGAGKSVSATTITANFSNVFSDKYGKIRAYTVIIATDMDEDHIKTSTLPDWKSAQVNPNIKAYQAIQNCSDFFHASSTCGRGKSKRAATERGYRIFTIGENVNCDNGPYCNGPLSQQTKYYIKLRAYTDGGYRDTVYSDPFVTEAVPLEDDGVNIGAIVGGLVPAILVICLILAIVFIRRRYQNKDEHARGHTTSMTPRSSFRGSKKSHEVKVGDFKEYIKTLSADSDFKYAEQFEDLKEIGRDQPCLAAELPVNRGKNRFTNILPYDHSRVKLLPTDDEEGSDYINANYMPGYTSKREYIVTQGPLPSTRDDFWRMIWEQNIRNIVMLTRCMEKGREKCDHYWPSGSDAMFYGDLQVATLSETRFPSWSISEFRMAYGNMTRPIRHFHFTAWPDFGVPDRPQTLIKFVRTVREQLIRECGPILVHCSAGVGRSGTFIVLDRLLQVIKEHDTVDIFGIVHDLRKERVWMVQTEQQYVCIHQCLLCVLEGREEEHVYQNVGIANAAFEADDEGINVEIPP